MIMKNKIEYRKKIIIFLIIFLSIVSLLNILSIFIKWQQVKGPIVLFLNYENWFSSHPRNGIIPYGMNSCTIILAAKLIGAGQPLRNRMNGLSGARHLFINFFENITRYGLIEAGHIGTNYGYGGRSFARIKMFNWDHDGYQWIIPTNECQEKIRCLKINTIRYHRASVPYHFYFGPNSNSFIWWLFKQCSVDIRPIFPKYPFIGIDYFWTHQFQSNYTKLQ